MSGPSDWPLPKKGVRFIVPHNKLKSLQKNKLTQDLYLRSFGYYPNAKGHVVVRKAHSDDLFLYCLGGSGSLYVNNQSHPVNSGDLMALPRNTEHVYAASPHNPWTLYWVHFGGSRVNDFWQYLGFNIERPVIRIGTATRLTTCFESLISNINTNFLEDGLIYGSNLLKEIFCLLQLTRIQNTADVQSFSIEKINEIMVENLYTDISLDDLASTVSMNRHVFCRRYKSITGTSPYKHFMYLKIKRACHYLDTTDESIMAVADLMGYTDQYYFSRVFKQIMGMPPSQYRKKRFG